MVVNEINPQDKFYFYHASFNPIRLIEKNAVQNLKATEEYLTNAFGVLINPNFLPEILEGKGGQVEGLPIPANWHADIAEFGAAFRALEFARKSFVMIELGCGWGCWINILGVVAKSKGFSVKLIGVEGDEKHIEFAKEALQANRFNPEEYDLYHGIAATKPGFALFPKHKQGGASWGSTPKFDYDENEAKKLIESGQYSRLPQVSLQSISQNIEKFDLLHVDIQGGEKTLIPDNISLLSDKVSYLVVGTHSRQIEGILLDCLMKAGWVLEMERPAVLSLGRETTVTVDGVQGWRNPKLLPDNYLEDSYTKGTLSITSDIHNAKSGEEITASVALSNQSSYDWTSSGQYPVYISYHWIADNSPTVVFDGLRTPLPDMELPAGKTAEQTIRILTPPSEGSYQLQVTLVKEGIQWFETPNFKGDTRKFTIYS